MKKKYFFLIISGLLLSVFLASGSGASENSSKAVNQTEKENKEDISPSAETPEMPQNASEHYSFSFYTPSTLPKDFTVFLPEVQFDNDKLEKLEETINTIIQKNATNWIKKTVMKHYKTADQGWCDIYCHDDSLLSVGMSYESDSDHTYIINDYITIDIKNGKRLYLKDLFDVEQLTKWIKNTDNYYAKRYQFSLEQEEGDEAIRKYMKKLSEDEIRSMLEQCSKSQKEFISLFEKEQDVNLENRANFYLTNDGLMIEVADIYHSCLHIKYKDMTEDMVKSDLLRGKIGK